VSSGAAGPEGEQIMAENAIETAAELGRIRKDDLVPDLVQVLREDGTLRSRVEPKIPPADLKRLYGLMVLCRQLDHRMMNLQRQGRIGFYMTATGEEAAIVGSVYALEPTDWILPCYREYAAALYRGYPLRDFICQLLGNAEDITKGRQMPIHIAVRALNFGSVSSPVGTQIPQAMGIAWAAKLRGDPTVALAYFGDGATSQGDFHVAANFAGVYKAPVIFLCRNNGWAISTPASVQTAAETFAQKAVAYGIEGVRVDGNDLLAVYEVTKRAAERARAGLGATLIEAVTYRRGAHSSSDDPSVYRDEAEPRAWEEKDPMVRLRRYLERKKLWSDRDEERALQEAQREVHKALEEAEAIPPPPPASLFDDVFADLPPHLVEQRQELLDAIKSKGR
jgi:2-oxoisovalerate dehydrogenase E1 component alpha subunit